MIVMQVYHAVGEDLNYLDYEEEGLEALEPACFHDMSNLESNGRWCRCWCILHDSSSSHAPALLGLCRTDIQTLLLHQAFKWR